MLSGGKRGLLLFLTLIVSIVIAIMGLHGQAQKNPTSVTQATDDERYGPIADFAAPEPADPSARAKRRSEGRRYDGRRLKEDPRVDESLLIDEWLYRLPAFPVALSDAVLIIEVTEAHAYMSNDKAGVYTEFTVRVNEALKDKQAAINVGSTLVTKREGGRIRFPSGHILRYGLEYQGMPKVGRRYLIFIRRNEPDETPYILTGYELRAGQVFPLDGVHQHAGAGKLKQFTDYQGADENTFLETVRGVIA
jgi:hypothetical protein